MFITPAGLWSHVSTTFDANIICEQAGSFSRPETLAVVDAYRQVRRLRGCGLRRQEVQDLRGQGAQDRQASGAQVNNPFGGLIGPLLMPVYLAGGVTAVPPTLLHTVRRGDFSSRDGTGGVLRATVSMTIT